MRRKKEQAAVEAQARHQVEAWQFGNVLLESYEYAPGEAARSEAHVHAEYQLCLSLDFPGMYAYRGASHAVPQGSLSILHPGEKHASADPQERVTRAHYRLFYIPPVLMQQITMHRDAQREPDTAPFSVFSSDTSSSNISSPLPFFAEPVLLARDLYSGFLELHTLLGVRVPLLEQESRLQTLLRELIRRHAPESANWPAPRPEQTLVRRIRAYIEANYDQDIALADLARLAARHPVYLNQMFQQAMGVPPHAYQTQIRIDRAKRLLASGAGIGSVAHQVGFYDQSHFGRYFRRYTGVTPARYRALKTS